jgi:hypothetical protein
MTYSTATHAPQNLVEISLDRAKAIIEMNKKGQKPDSLQEEASHQQAPVIDFTSSVSEGSLTRFDNKNKKKKKKRNKHKNHDKKQDNNEPA